MPFTVNDFHDLLALLGTHPEWRDELRRLVLADELIDLPGLVRDLAAAQVRTEQGLQVLGERVEALTRRMDALTERMNALAERMDALAERMDALTERMDTLTERMGELAAAQGRTEVHVDRLRGDVLEFRFRERGAPALGLLGFRRVRVLSGTEQLDLADEALESARVTAGERDELLRLDAVARGRDADGEVWLAVEVSATGDAHDAERAERRAAILAKAGGRARPVVVATRFTDGAQLRRSKNETLVLVSLPSD